MRIIFVTDIHIGALPDGYQMQPRWIEGTHVLLERFVLRMRDLAPDLIVVGGDTVERGTCEQIQQACAFLASLPAKTLLCLGNHDLTQIDSLEIWRREVAGLEHVVMADALLETPDCDVIGLSTYWLNEKEHPELHWASGTYPRACAPEGQMRQLQQWLSRDSGRPAILATHAQLNGVPAAICGGERPFEPPVPAFEAAVRSVMDRHARLRLTLSGHCHVGCAIQRGERIELTGTSFTERPFQFPEIGVSGGRIEIQTHRIECKEGSDLVQERLWVCENPTGKLLRP